MKKLDIVKIIHGDYEGKQGIIVDRVISSETKYEYIVQFLWPFDWTFFDEEELEVLVEGRDEIHSDLLKYRSDMKEDQSA